LQSGQALQQAVPFRIAFDVPADQTLQPI
jgi:hypothetical protein